MLTMQGLYLPYCIHKYHLFLFQQAHALHNLFLYLVSRRDMMVLPGQVALVPQGLLPVLPISWAVSL